MGGFMDRLKGGKARAASERAAEEHAAGDKEAIMINDNDLGAVSGGVGGTLSRCPSCGKEALEFSGDPNGSWLKRCYSCGYTWNSMQEAEKNQSTGSGSSMTGADWIESLKNQRLI